MMHKTKIKGNVRKISQWSLVKEQVELRKLRENYVTENKNMADQ